MAQAGSVNTKRVSFHVLKCVVNLFASVMKAALLIDVFLPHTRPFVLQICTAYSYTFKKIILIN